MVVAVALGAILIVIAWMMGAVADGRLGRNPGHAGAPRAADVRA